MTEPLDGRQLIRELQPRQARASVALETALGIEEQPYPSLFEDTAFFRFIKGIEIRHTTPELRFGEVDQTDPAGRYRMGSTGDNFVMARSGTANFANVLGSASDFDFLEYNRSNTYLGLFALESNSWYIRFDAGAGPGTQAYMALQGHATAPSIDLRTGNAAGSNASRITIQGGAGSPDIDIASATLDMNGNIIKGASSIYGQGNSAIYLRGNRAVTDATAHRIIGLVLNPADDTEYQAFAAVPKAATPLFTFAGSDYVPTTSELDDGHYYLGYTKATNTATLYMNEGGVIVSLALGVLA